MAVMKAINVKIPRAYRIFLYIFLSSSWLTGMLFFVLNRWFAVEGLFGVEQHPWQFSILKLHGFAAFGMLMAYGALIANHVPMSWKTGRLRGIGLALVSALTLQVLTAYGLYYVADHQMRTVTSAMHTLVGGLLPFILALHIWRGINAKRRNRRTTDANNTTRDLL